MMGCWMLDVGRWMLRATAGLPSSDCGRHCWARQQWHTMIIAVLIGVLSSLAAAGDASPLPEVTVKCVGGEQVTGRLVALDAEQAILETPDGRREINADTLLGIDISPEDPGATDSPARPSVWTELTDGMPSKP